MSVREYIGARYIPLFSDPIEWSADNTYEPLTVVINQGNSYVSKQYVPVGAPLPPAGEQSNDYWLLWADYNAQIEQYRAEVATFSGRINANTAAIQTLNGELTTEVSAREAADTAIREDFAADLAEEIAAVNATISADVDRLETQDEALGARIDSAIDGAQMQTLLANTLQLTPASRILIGDSWNSLNPPFFGTGAAQGGCLFDVSGKDYWAQLTSGGTNFIVVDVATTRPVANVAWAVGHGNGLSWDENVTLMAVDEVNRQLKFMNVANPLSPVEDGAVAFPSQVANSACACFIGNTGKVAIAEGALGGYQNNPSGVHIFSDRTLTSYEGFVPFAFDFTQYAGYQSVSCDSKHFYVGKSTPENVCVFDMTGAHVGNIQLPRYSGIDKLAEIEDAFAYKGNFYVVNGGVLRMSALVNKQTLTTKQATDKIAGFRTASLLECNLSGKSISPVISASVYNMAQPVSNSASYHYAYIDFGSLATDWANTASNVFQRKVMGIPVSGNNPNYYFVDDFLNLLEGANIPEGATISFKNDYPFEVRLGVTRPIRITTGGFTQEGGVEIYGLRGNCQIALDNANAAKPITFRAIDDSATGTGSKYPIIMQGGNLVSGGNIVFGDDGQKYDVQLRTAIGAIPNAVTSRVQLVANGKNLG